MCQKLLNELRICNKEIDRETSDAEKIEILWRACVMYRKALTRLMQAGLELPDLTPERRTAFENFLEEMGEANHPLRSHDGNPDTRRT